MNAESPEVESAFQWSIALVAAPAHGAQPGGSGAAAGGPGGRGDPPGTPRHVAPYGATPPLPARLWGGRPVCSPGRAQARPARRPLSALPPIPPPAVRAAAGSGAEPRKRGSSAGRRPRHQASFHPLLPLFKEIFHTQRAHSVRRDYGVTGQHALFLLYAIFDEMRRPGPNAVGRAAHPRTPRSCPRDGASLLGSDGCARSGGGHGGCGPGAERGREAASRAPRAAVAARCGPFLALSLCSPKTQTSNERTGESRARRVG